MQSRIKVAIGTIYPYDESFIKGGVEAVAFYLIQELSKREDIELHVVSCNRGIKNNFKEKRGNVQFHWIATGKRFYNIRALTIDAYRVRKVYEEIKPDIIHVQGISEYSVAAKDFDKMILTVHGLESYIENTKSIKQFKGLAGKYRRFTSNIILKKSLNNAYAITSNAGDYVYKVLGKRIQDKKVIN